MEPAKRARTEFFPSISKIRYEGPESTNPLAFKYYQPDELVMGKKMRRFAPKPGGAFQDPHAGVHTGFLGKRVHIALCSKENRASNISFRASSCHAFSE